MELFRWHLGTFLLCRHLGTLFVGAMGTGPGLLVGIDRSSALSKPCGQKMPNMSTVASIVSYRSCKIIDTTVNMFINVGVQKHATGRFDQFEGISRPQGGRSGQFFAVTKKVTVLIFAIFCPRGLEGERQSGPGGGVSRPKGPKRGRRLSCTPVLWILRLFAAGFYAASSNCELYRSA